VVTVGDADHLGEPGDRPGWLDGIPESKIQAHAERVEANEDTDTTDGSAIAGPNARNWDFPSRPSKTNPSAPDSGSDTPADGPAQARRKWWHRKNELVDEWLDTAPDRSARPVSVRADTTLRDEAGVRKADGSDRSETWSHVLREFLGWYNDYRKMHLRFRNPDGDLVRSPMPNSHQPQYGDTYYARLKALERQFLARADDPYVVMLTFTASTENANGGWRCPADHLRDVIESFTQHVRPALHRALGSNGADVDSWEYARVVEHHQTGYGHMHVPLFIDGEVTEEDLQPVIDTHLRHCDPAGASAHDYYAPEAQARPISVARVDTDLNPEDYDGTDDVIGNVGSYVAEYIGSYGEDLFDRSIEELAFRAMCWATGSDRVDFSNGAQELIDAELEDGEEIESDTPEQPDPDRWATEEEIEEIAADPDRSVSDELPEQDGWELDGIGIVDRDGETRHEVENTGVEYIQIDGAEHLDPPKMLPPDRPKPRSNRATLGEFK